MKPATASRATSRNMAGSWKVKDHFRALVIASPAEPAANRFTDLGPFDVTCAATWRSTSTPRPGAALPSSGDRLSDGGPVRRLLGVPDRPGAAIRAAASLPDNLLSAEQKRPPLAAGPPATPAARTARKPAAPRPFSRE